MGFVVFGGNVAFFVVVFLVVVAFVVVVFLVVVVVVFFVVVFLVVVVLGVVSFIVTGGNVIFMGFASCLVDDDIGTAVEPLFRITTGIESGIAIGTGTPRNIKKNNDRRKGKGRHCCFGDRIDSIH